MAKHSVFVLLTAKRTAQQSTCFSIFVVFCIFNNN